MKIEEFKKSVFRGIIIGVVILIVFLFGQLLVPYIFDMYKGEEIVEKHILEVVGNETEHPIISANLMNWAEKNIEYPRVEDKIFAVVGSGLYNVNGDLKYFIRSSKPSWIINSGLGRCGESADYFVGIMSELGFEARKISPRGWDHQWVEYLAPEGAIITVDPSQNKVITDLQEWIEGRGVTKITAKYINGTKIDVTHRYYS